MEERMRRIGKKILMGLGIIVAGFIASQVVLVFVLLVAGTMPSNGGSAIVVILWPVFSLTAWHNVRIRATAKKATTATFSD